jgi:hypothetical protein
MRGADIVRIPYLPDFIWFHIFRRKERGPRAANVGTFRVAICFPPEGSATDTDCRVGGDVKMSIGTIILIILVIALLGGFSGVGGGPFYGTGYYGGGGLGLVVVILLILLLLGRL